MESVNYDRAAEYYDATRALPAEAMAKLTDLLVETLADRQPCLEIGVGSGRFALPLRERGITLAGIDVSGAMLRRLIANAGSRGSLPLAQADATRQPFAAGTFGSVLAVHVLHLIPYWRVALDEALRVLRPGGSLIVSFPTDRPTTQRSDAVTERLGLPGGPGAVDALGLRLDGAAPWAGAVREAAGRHGMSLAPVGARDPRAVAAYLDRRVTVRELEPVLVSAAMMLGDVIDTIRRQRLTWTWPHTAAQAEAVASDVLAWAERERVPLTEVHVTVNASRWWVFELPQLDTAATHSAVPD